MSPDRIAIQVVCDEISVVLQGEIRTVVAAGSSRPDLNISSVEGGKISVPLQQRPLRSTPALAIPIVMAGVVIQNRVSVRLILQMVLTVRRPEDLFGQQRVIVYHCSRSTLSGDIRIPIATPTIKKPNRGPAALNVGASEIVCGIVGRRRAAIAATTLVGAH